MLVAHPFQVGAEKLYQVRIVDQDCPSFAAFSHDGQMLIIEREVEILHVQGEPLADPQACLQEQTGEESVPLTLSGNGFENAFNLVALYTTRLWRIEFHPLNFEHGVAVEQVVLMRPGEEARYGGLLARSGGRTEVKVRPKEIPQVLRCQRVH